MHEKGMPVSIQWSEWEVNQEGSLREESFNNIGTEWSLTFQLCSIHALIWFLQFKLS